MIPYVIYICSAFWWSFSTRSVTFPLLVLALFNIGCYWPFLYEHDELELSARLAHEYAAKVTLAASSRLSYNGDEGDDLESIVNELSQLTPNDDANLEQLASNVYRGHLSPSVSSSSSDPMHIIDKLRYQHLLYQFLCMLYFVGFSFIGYFLSQTIRYPPLLDVIYIRRQPFYCFKVLLGILLYHATCVPLALVDGPFLAAIGTTVLTLAWSSFFYYVLTMEDVEWHHTKSIRSSLFYANVFVGAMLLCHGAAASLVPDTDKKIVTLVTGIAAFAAILCLRVSKLRNRKVAKSMERYAHEKQQCILHRCWFGFPFETSAEQNKLMNDFENERIEEGDPRQKRRGSDPPDQRRVSPAKSVYCRSVVDNSGASEIRRRGGGGGAIINDHCDDYILSRRRVHDNRASSSSMISRDDEPLPPPPARRGVPDSTRKRYGPSMYAGTANAPPGRRPYDLRDNPMYREHAESDYRAKRTLERHRAANADAAMLLGGQSEAENALDDVGVGGGGGGHIVITPSKSTSDPPAQLSQSTLQRSSGSNVKTKSDVTCRTQTASETANLFAQMQDPKQRSMIVTAAKSTAPRSEDSESVRFVADDDDDQSVM